MGISADLESGVDEILSQTWSVRDGVVVPESDDVALGGGAVKVHVAILYSDLARSTALVSDFDARTAARLMKSFLYCSSRIIKANGGAIRSFDGDRVMGIFIGDAKNSAAAKAALQINYAVLKIIGPKVVIKYPILATRGFVLKHATGVDRSDILAVRAGMRGENDLIWIGRSAAVAAKLSSIRDVGWTSFITKDVYDNLNEPSKIGGDPMREMWEKVPVKHHGLTIYRSNWHWKP
jgi:uridylate cyclase